jgi:hypothetical protein
MDYLKKWIVMKMSKKEKNKNDRIFKEYSLKQAGMLVQIILVFFLIIFAILTIFYSQLKIACFLISGLTLIVMAYNNHKIYKRKTLTIIYLLGALLSFWSVIEMVFIK